ncbi:hypothetical protein NFI96_006607 [Prochilodus magdalenae]|nr:hypothetical protein NFI96_006607 [Prochilodus magdalenae]
MSAVVAVWSVRLDYCNLLLAGLPLRATRPLQLVQNAAARLIFNLPKFTHVTPLLHSLHWLPVVARIRFKTLMLAYKAKNGPAPPYLMAMVKSRAVPRALRASSIARLEPPSLRTHGRQASRLFSVLAPRWWNELPLGVRTAESLAVFKRRLKTHLFVMHLKVLAYKDVCSRPSPNAYKALHQFSMLNLADDNPTWSPHLAFLAESEQVMGVAQALDACQGTLPPGLAPGEPNWVQEVNLGVLEPPESPVFHILGLVDLME